MKKILLIILCLVAFVSGAEKITVIGDSKMGGTIMDTAKNHFSDTSRFVNRAAPGNGWQNYDAENSNPHYLDSWLVYDTTTYLLMELGLNNIWQPWNVTGSVYYNQIDDFKLLDRWYRICQAYGVKFGLIEMGPCWFTSIADSANARILSEIKERNAKRKEWCAYNGVYWIPTFDSLKLPNDHPNPTLHNADLCHYSQAGMDLVGRQIATYFKTVPTKTLVYNRLKSAKITLPAYSSSSTLHHTYNMSAIKDTVFWHSIKPDGSNLALFINGVKTNRILRDLVTYGNRGVLEYVYSGAISTLELKTGNYNERDTVVYTNTNLNRYYRLNEKKSNPTPIVDIVNAYNTTNTPDNWTTYYYNPTWNIYNDSCYKKTLVGNANAQSAVQTGFQGATKFTYEVWMQIYGSGFWSNNNYFFSMGTTPTLALVVSQSAGVRFYINSSTILAYTPYATAQPLLTANKWHKLVVQCDLTQSNQSDKVKMIIDSTDVSSSIVVSGTIGTSIGTIAQTMNLFGWYTAGTFWPVGCTFRDIKFYAGTAMSPAEAIADYRIQSAQFTLSNYSTTGSSRWDAFKASTKPAYKKTWK